VLAAIPIFLLWIYLSWVIVILAASIAASASAFEYHAPMETLPEGAEFLGLLVILRHFVEAQRAGGCVDPATVRAQEPYLRSALIAAYFEDLREADMIQRGEAGGWLLCRSLDCTDLLRVYRHINYPLPLKPVEEAAALGIELPPELLATLADLAGVLQAKLGAKLDQIYPVAAPPAADTEEPLP
jgi:membrane protein